jgi:F-type H+-transporting ATPase subunit alpha
MKKNAGKMKLAMAQYRELESFAQFDSDLDHETKKTIERGKRTAEILKQAQGSPLRVSLQVASVYAVNNGFIDHVTTSDVQTWEEKMHAYLISNEIELLDALDTGWDETIESNLKKALESFSSNNK